VCLRNHVLSCYFVVVTRLTVSDILDEHRVADRRHFFAVFIRRMQRAVALAAYEDVKQMLAKPQSSPVDLLVATTLLNMDGLYVLYLLRTPQP